MSTNIYENNFGIDETIGSDGVVAPVTVTRDFGTLSTDDPRVKNALNNTCISVMLGCHFLSKPAPTLRLGGSVISVSGVTSVSQIKPTDNTAFYLIPSSESYTEEGVTNILYLPLSALGKTFVVQFSTDQSVFEAWELNEIATKVNNLEPTTINGKLLTITENADGTYNGDFKNIKDELSAIDDNIEQMQIDITTNTDNISKNTENITNIPATINCDDVDPTARLYYSALKVATLLASKEDKSYGNTLYFSSNGKLQRTIAEIEQGIIELSDTAYVFKTDVTAVQYVINANQVINLFFNLSQKDEEVTSNAFTFTFDIVDSTRATTHTQSVSQTFSLKNGYSLNQVSFAISDVLTVPVGGHVQITVTETTDSTVEMSCSVSDISYVSFTTVSSSGSGGGLSFLGAVTFNTTGTYDFSQYLNPETTFIMYYLQGACGGGGVTTSFAPTSISGGGGAAKSAFMCVDVTSITDFNIVLGGGGNGADGDNISAAKGGGKSTVFGIEYAAGGDADNSPQGGDGYPSGHSGTTLCGGNGGGAEGGRGAVYSTNIHTYGGSGKNATIIVMQFG